MDLLTRIEAMLVALEFAKVDTVEGCETCGPEHYNQCPICEYYEDGVGPDWRGPRRKTRRHESGCALEMLIGEVRSEIRSTKEKQKSNE